MKKYAWVLALFAALALVFIGCDDGDNKSGTTTTEDVTWSLSQTGGDVDTDNKGTADTTAIVITFNKSVDLVASNVTYPPTGRTADVTLGTLARGTGNTWTIPVTAVTEGGLYNVRINQSGIVTATQDVTIIKAGQTQLINYTVVADGDANTTSTKLTFTFEQAVTGLTTDNIGISPTTNVVWGALTGSGTAYELPLTTVSAAGSINVTVTHESVVASSKAVALNYVASSLPELTGTVTLNSVRGSGATITATYSGNGSGAASWAWYLVDGTAATLISSATSDSYTTVAGDVGKQIRASVSFAEQSGLISGTASVVADPGPWYHNLAASDGSFTIRLGDNFQYGEGYQGQYFQASLFAGDQVVEGDIFWLNATFTLDRDLEDDLWAGLVDTVTDYWNPLTWDSGDDGVLIQNEGKSKGTLIQENEEINATFKFVALKTAPSAALSENVLNFQTKGAGTQGDAGSGVEGPVVMKFTKFVFARDTTYDSSKEGQAPEPPLPSTEGVTALGTTTWVNPDQANQIGWDLADWQDFKDAKYLVVETLPGNAGGFGGVNVILAAGGWQQSNLFSGDWTSFNRPAEAPTYLVIELDTLVGYSTVLTQSSGRIVIANWPIADLNPQKAYLLTDHYTLTAGTGDLVFDGDVTGYATTNLSVTLE